MDPACMGIDHIGCPEPPKIRLSQAKIGLPGSKKPGPGPGTRDLGPGPELTDPEWWYKEVASCREGIGDDGCGRWTGVGGEVEYGEPERLTLGFGPGVSALEEGDMEAGGERGGTEHVRDRCVPTTGEQTQAQPTSALPCS